MEAGDWALISVQPFTSEETLTVTMKDGEVFTIRVTDAQIKKTVIDAKGDTWEITVTYGEDAQIPDGAELRVEEILPEDEGYEEYYQKSLEKVGVSIPETEGSGEVADALIDDAFADAVEELTDLIVSDNDEEEIEEPAKKAASDYARIFDIEIWADDHKVEPVADVTVNIKLLNAPGETEATPQVVHFAEDGAELMELKVKDENSEDEGIQFVTDEFSVYSVVYTVDFSFNINGKEYSFSLEGGDSTSFKEIIERFKILDKENVELFINNIATVEFSNPDYLWNGKLEEDAFAGDLKEKYNLDIQYASNIREGNILAMNVHHYSAPDWVLIALKPFTSEETLTITMKNGEVFTVKVTDAQSDAIHNSDGTVQTISNPQGTSFELFNYFVDSGTKTTPKRDQWPGHVHGDEFRFNWYDRDGNYYKSFDEGYNECINNENYLLGYGNNLGINKNHVFKFSPANAGTVVDGTKDTKTKDVNGGSGLNGWTQDADPNQGIVQGTLVNGYPILTNNPNLGTNGESLAYLFDASAQEGKESYGTVNHLLYVDPEGYYTYDSRDFKAYIQNDGNFKVYNQPDTTDTELKGFWPFGDQIFWSGLHMNTQFSMPTNGQVLNPKGEMKDMQFEFSGDDDTWLYIDGVLVGDGGGIHNRTEIDVNFAKGTVTVTGKKDDNHTGTFEETKYLDDIFKAAGKYNDTDWEDIGDGSGHKRFKAGTYHTFDMFYLERGGGESNLYIHYNLVSTADFTGHKAYEGLGEDDRLARDQFQFELIGLDGQYQSVWDSTTQTATVSLVNADVHAIMPTDGTESGAGTVASPKKVYDSQAWGNSEDGYKGGYTYTTGVTEDGNINFGTAEISETEMHNCGEGHPSVYRYIIREVVPGDAVNQNGVRWDAATEEQKAAGGFVKDQITYDGTIYYMTARVTSWTETKPDGTSYTRYGLSKTYYTDDTFETVDNNVTFIDFRNRYTPDSGKVEFLKVDGSNNPLSGATFTLYTNEDCTHVAKDLDGEEQVITTGADGKVVFDNMAAPKTYYMKETAVPNGYQLNTTVYKVIIEDSKDTTKTSKIIVNGDETETPVTKIINTKPGELSVIKKWVDQNGREVAGGSNTARVQLRRYHYAASGGNSSTETHSVTVTFKFDHSGGWGVAEKTFTGSVQGSKANISWNVGGAKFYWDQTYTNQLTSPNNGSYSVEVALSSGANSFTIYCSDEWAGNNLNNCTIEAVQEQVTYNLVKDTDFPASTDTTATQVLSSTNNWAYTWKIGSSADDDFPANDGTNPYYYYIVEQKDNGDGTWSDVAINGELSDGITLKSIAYSPEKTSDAGIQEGLITVINEVAVPAVIDVVIKKTDNVENSTNYLAGAVFKLEYRADENGTYTNVSNSTVPELDAESKFTVPTTGLKLTGLTDGQYRIQEVSPPDGYVITNQYPITFKVENGAITNTTGTLTDVRYTAATSSTDATFIVPNTPGVALPSTGGPGTTALYLLGIMLTAFAGAGLVMRKRRRDVA